MMKSMLKFKKRKLNNKGMSLVEVLVAMIILTMVGVTVLKSFGFSFQSNAKAKEKQHALTYAQSMMEVAKAYDVDELNHGKYMVLNAASQSATATPSTHTYIYRQDGVDSKYNVTMTMTPSVSDGTNAKTVSDIYNIHNPSEETDACLVQNIEDEQDKLLQNAWSVLLTAADGVDSLSGKTYLHDYMMNELGDYSFLNMGDSRIKNRIIRINANKNAAGVVTVTADVEYNYSVHMDFTYTDESGRPVSGILNSGDMNYTYHYNNFYANNAVDPDFRNVYFFYYPLYSGTDGFEELKYLWMSGSDDEIVISSNIDQFSFGPYSYVSNVGVYLVKQKLPAATPTRQAALDAKLMGLEANYHVTIKKTSGSKPISIYHNLNQSLYHAAYAAPVFLVNTDDGSEILENLLVKKAEEPLVYDVVVEVNDLSGNNIYTLNGTTNIR